MRSLKGFYYMGKHHRRYDKILKKIEILRTMGKNNFDAYAIKRILGYKSWKKYMPH